MRELSLWLRQDNVPIYLGGNPDDKEIPSAIVKINKPQVIVDYTKNIIIIKETK